MFSSTLNGKAQVSLSTPVLLVIFNRPDLTRRVLEAIGLARPSILLVAADGPRSETERELCDKTRSLLDNIDWPCELITTFSDTNLGCGVRVHSAVTWAMSQFENVIVLEDDCVPSRSFFFFCETLLTHYADDERVMHIGGFNFQPDKQISEASYYFSKYPLASGGWATWRRAWKYYDWSIQNWPVLKAQGLISRWCPDPIEAEYWTQLFDSVYLGAIDVWDYQWNLACWGHGGLSILPSVQLLSNIGFGDDATHTKDPISHLLPAPGEIESIKHPIHFEQSKDLDAFVFNFRFGGAGMRAERSIARRMRIVIGNKLPWLKRLLVRIRKK